MNHKGLKVLAVMLFTMPVALSAQSTASRNVTVSSQVVKALTLTSSSSTLAFGSMAQNTTKSIDPHEAGAIKFTANGEPNTSIRMLFATATLSNGGDGRLTFTPEVAGGSVDEQDGATAVESGEEAELDAETGNYFFYVGGSLPVANDPVGSYSGTWTLTVEYTGI